MKKKIIIGLMVAAIGCSFVGCEESGSNQEYTNEEGVKVSSTLEKINNNLVYDRSTHIVYYKHYSDYEHYSYAYMSPYISKDGTYCKYEDGKVVPLEKGE